MSRIGQHPTAVARFFLAALTAGAAVTVAGCAPSAILVNPTPTSAIAREAEPATLVVNVEPLGATVWIDGQPEGTTPLTLSLTSGQHALRVEKDGYQTLEETLVLPPHGKVVVDRSLVDVTPPSVAIQWLPKRPLSGQHLVVYVTAYDNVAVARLELWIDGRRVLEGVGATAAYHWDPPTDAVGQHVVIGRAYDVTGNVATLEQSLVVSAPSPTLTTVPKPPPTATPVPLPTVTPSSSPTLTLPPESTPYATPTPVPVSNAYYETTLSIPTYPYAEHLWQETDVRYGVALWRLDRAAYEAARPAPTARIYRALVVENEYLQLTFLPELGGRLYRCVYKPTGQNIFYQNPVIKPSHWGPLTPSEHNWWLAAGGMEWAWPVHEHGYEFGTPWSHSVQATSQGVTVTLWDSQDRDRLRFEVRVTLPSRQATFTVRPRLINPLAEDVEVQLWINAMLTLGSHSIAPETEFVLPAGQVVVHSTGDAMLAAEGEAISWPMDGDRDLSHYANWRQWLGVFIQQSDQSFVGAYNHATDLGVVRLFSPQAVPGVKLFAFGPDFGDRGHYTDDGSQYFELWGGPNRTFWPADDIQLPSGGEIAWEETWQPFAGIGGLTYANERATLFVDRSESQVDLGLNASTPVQGWLRLLTEQGEREQIVWESAVTLSPDAPLRQSITLPVDMAASASLRVQLADQSENVLLDYYLED